MCPSHSTGAETFGDGQSLRSEELSGKLPPVRNSGDAHALIRKLMTFLFHLTHHGSRRSSAGMGSLSDGVDTASKRVSRPARVLCLPDDHHWFPEFSNASHSLNGINWKQKTPETLRSSGVLTPVRYRQLPSGC